MLTYRRLLVLVLAACGSTPSAVTPAPAPAVVATPEPAKPPAPTTTPAGVKQYDAATLFKNVGVVAAGFSRDGSKALVSTDASGVYNLYAIPTAGGEPERLTTSGESQFAVSYFPGDD